ncbi:MAG: 4-hydroxythreonine-4-phosphate dehydrogenase PdxA [Bacteroidota bacterium]
MNKIVVGITQGDINGISYEVIIKSFLDNRVIDHFTPVLYGSPKVAAYHRKALNITNFSFNNINNIEEANPKRANIIDVLDDEIKVEFGKPTRISGDAAFKSLEAATSDILKGKFEILVTSPINKSNIQCKDFDFPGHTEYLKSKFHVDDVLMIMVADYLKVGVVTGHIPLRDVASSINKEIILKKLNLLNASLIEDFAIRKPKIAVLGLNPHAGDDGLIGDEEINHIIPAINQARENGIMAIGPYSADGLFGSGQYKRFDAVLAMYHDQGLIAFKSLSFNDGVNYTAGLPIVRTSPAHGTAFDIVGENQANEESFRNALYIACDIFKNRIEHKNLLNNPVKKHQIEEAGKIE